MPFASDVLASIFWQKYIDAVRLLYQFVVVMQGKTHSPEEGSELSLVKWRDSKIPTLRRWGGVPELDLFGNRTRTPVIRLASVDVDGRNITKRQTSRMRDGPHDIPSVLGDYV